MDMARARGHYTTLNNLMGSLNVSRHRSPKEIAKKLIRKGVRARKDANCKCRQRMITKDDIATTGEIIYWERLSKFPLIEFGRDLRN
jgi:hypothetical protein